MTQRTYISGPDALRGWMAHQEPRSQREWAARLGISQSYLSQILSAVRDPGRDTILQIERATAGEVPAAAWFVSTPAPGCGAGGPSGRRAGHENHPRSEGGPPFPT